MKPASRIALPNLSSSVYCCVINVSLSRLCLVVAGYANVKVLLLAWNEVVTVELGWRHGAIASRADRGVHELAGDEGVISLAD